MNTGGPSLRRGGFTLLEIMVVVAIMGLIMAMGVPSLLASLKKDGIRKAESDLVDVFAQARGQAIMQNHPVAVTFHPGDRSFETSSGGAGTSQSKVTFSSLPDGVTFAMLDINLMDFSASDWCKVWFYPDGTSDEATLVVHEKDLWRKLTLEFSTGLPTVTDDMAK